VIEEKFMSPKHLRIEDFDYDLPDEKIAKHPLEKRDESKLLVYGMAILMRTIYANLAAYLPGNAFVIFNNTKVVEARLLFKKPTGTAIEIFCLEPADAYADITTAMLQHNKVLWKCLVGNAKKWKMRSINKTNFSRYKRTFIKRKKNK
jgi:S-adenosylmethionine:tRNA ribosyltransferase-isomerase